MGGKPPGWPGARRAHSRLSSRRATKPAGMDGRPEWVLVFLEVPRPCFRSVASGSSSRLFPRSARSVLPVREHAPQEKTKKSGRAAGLKTRPNAAALCGTALRACYATAVHVVPGEIVGHRYRLDRPLGEGGMGAVWAATHTVTQKCVALKLLAGRGDDAALRRRLVREARAVCAIEHPNVVPVHDVFEIEGGAPVLVMDLLEGESLAARLERETTIPHGELVTIAIDVLSALEAAHARGIIHRDLKPANIFLARPPHANTASFEVKVLDFGIAKMPPLGQGEAALTATDAMVGTPYYMAPEQVYGEKDIDARCDLWAVGIVLYECLAGVRPTEAANLGQIFKLVTVGPFPPLEEKAPNAPAALAKLVTSCLSRSRDARPASATALREALERVLADTTMNGTELSSNPVRAKAPGKRHTWVAAAFVLGATAAAAGIAIEAPARPPSSTAKTIASSTPVTDSTSTAAAALPTLRPSDIPTAGSRESPLWHAPDAGPPSSPVKTIGRLPSAALAGGDERSAGKVVLTPPF